MPIMWAVRSAVGSLHHRTADVAAAHGDQSVGLQQVDGLAQCGRTDPELLEQALLGGQDVTLAQTAGQDVVAQFGSRRSRQPGAAGCAVRVLPSTTLSLLTCTR